MGSRQRFARSSRSDSPHELAAATHPVRGTSEAGTNRPTKSCAAKSHSVLTLLGATSHSGGGSMAASNEARKDSHTGELAMITGASTGIGYELARRCAIEGFDLIV